MPASTRSDQRLDPAQRPPLIRGEPVRQRAFHQLGLQPGPLLRTEPLPRHRPFGSERLSPARPAATAAPPRRDPQVVCDLADPVAAGEPPGGLQPQPLPPLLLGGRVPAPLRVPHTRSYARNQPTSRPRFLRVQPG